MATLLRERIAWHSSFQLDFWLTNPSVILARSLRGL